jgi:hypothetical protein
MKFHISPVIWVAIGINFLALATVTSIVVFRRTNSDNAITERAKGLKLVAQNFKADTCWTSRSKKPFKLGDEINPLGSLKGKIPTSCIKSIKTGQILQVAYSEGKLIVSQIYSKTELRNQLSILKEQGNSNDETQRKRR